MQNSNFGGFFNISTKSKKKFFLTPLGKSRNFNFLKIFNDIGSHDVLKKKIAKIGQNATNPSFFDSSCTYVGIIF